MDFFPKSGFGFLSAARFWSTLFRVSILKNDGGKNSTLFGKIVLRDIYIYTNIYMGRHLKFALVCLPHAQLIHVAHDSLLHVQPRSLRARKVKREKDEEETRKG